MARERTPDRTRIGKFRIKSGAELLGHLSLSGPASVLRLFDDDKIDFEAVGEHLTGVLNDGEKVSLHKCVPLNSFSGGQEGRSCTADVFPNFVLEGPCHLQPDDEAIRSLLLFVEDAPSLFYDFDAFGKVIGEHVKPIMELVAANHPRQLDLGDHPEVLYYTGRSEITSVETAIGTVKAAHFPSMKGIGGPSGVGINNRVGIIVEPVSRINFEDALRRAVQLLMFLDLIAGRQQNILEFSVDVGEPDTNQRLRVHWSHYPVRPTSGDDALDSPRTADVPLDPVRRSDEFRGVLRRWLAGDQERRSARMRFHTSFVQGNYYTTDRLVGAANMFDLLPDAAVPKDVPLSDDLKEAKKESRELFLALPESPERNSVLGALGRVGKPSLKHKVHHRARFILDVARERFPNLLDVLSEAVNCRNFYVHGTESKKIDYNEDNDFLTFFVDSLEFVFATSELVECGWDLSRFLAAGTTGSHRLGRYRISYKAATEELLKRMT